MSLITGTPAAPVQWTAPPQCPDQAQAQALVDAELAEITALDRETLEIQGTVRPDPPGFVLEVVLHSAEGNIERSVRLEDCDVAAEALALVVAIAVDPRRAPDRDASPIEPTDASPTDAAPTDAAPTEPAPAETNPADASAPSGAASTKPEPEPERRSSFETSTEPEGAAPGRDRPEAIRSRVPRAAVSIGGGVGLGVLPTTGGQVEGAAAAVWRRARLGVQLDYWVRRRARLPGTRIGGNLSIISARLVGGAIVPWRRLEFPFLGFVGVGTLIAQGAGLDESSTSAVLWAETGARAGIQWFVRPWLGLGAHAEFLVALVRHTFVLSNTEVVTRTGPVGGGVRAGLEFRFP
ncbi:MAG: hypothetical protein AAGF11_31125 [Myxococcota bacterium]